MLIIFSLLLTFGSWASTLERVTCLNQLSEVLIQLKVTSPWKPVASQEKFIFMKAMASNKQKFTAWVYSNSDESRLIITKNKDVIQHSFTLKNDCQMLTRYGKKDSKTFNGLDLLNISIKDNIFLILLWSPHMSISLSQIQDFRDKKFSLPVIYLLDESADDKLASSYIKKEKFPASYLRKWQFLGHMPASVEHYPSVLLVKEGKIVKYLPGFSSAKALNDFIKANL